MEKVFAVQMSKDGVPFCSPKADLGGTTTAATDFISRSSTVPGDMLANGVAAKPPKPAPIPTIETTDFVDPPLPPVAKLSEPTANDTSTPADADSTSNTTTAAAPKPSKSTKLDGNIILTIVIVMVGALSILSIH